MWSLTLRSSGAPTAVKRGRATVQVCIFCSAGPLAHRCRPLSSNVRLHKMHFCASPTLRSAMLRSRLRRAPVPNHLVRWWRRVYCVLFRNKDTNLPNSAKRGQGFRRSESIGLSFGSAAFAGVYRNRQFQNQFGPLLSHNTSIPPIATRTAQDNVALANRITQRKNLSVCFQGQIYYSLRLRQIRSLVACGA
jgi:hypothetical protein